MTSKICTTFIFSLLFLIPVFVDAASLSVSPATGVYTSGATFTVQVSVNSSGAAINAADGTLSFNPRELSVVSVSRASSIFSLWTSEPAFSNSAGTVTFSGGSPSGYTGSAGNVMTVTFRTLTSGTAKVAIANGSVLAADGRGTNVLTSMNGGTYTISAVDNQPAPEVIVEYVPPANTPATPAVNSPTHPDRNGWYQKTEAVLNWNLPSDATGVRTLLDQSPSSIPTKVYEPGISTITLSDLDEGVSYFHIQFRNAEGWGKVAHIRLGVDTTKPENFTLALAENADLTKPEQILVASFGSTTQQAPISRYKVQVDGKEPYEVEPGEDNVLALNALAPGYHTIVVEAFDAAGNSNIASLSFTVLAFDKPVFTDYPRELSAGVIPVIKGSTRPNATVEVTVASGSTEPKVYKLASDESGQFIFIPDAAFAEGVYTLTAVAIDSDGARSEPSDEAKIAVQQPGYLAIGSFLINVLSVLISLLALLFISAFGCWYMLMRFKRFRGKVRRETVEAAAILEEQFAALVSTLDTEALTLAQSRRTGKLTKSEEQLVEHLRTTLATAKEKVRKEVADVSALVRSERK